MVTMRGERSARQASDTYMSDLLSTKEFRSCCTDICRVNMLEEN